MSPAPRTSFHVTFLFCVALGFGVTLHAASEVGTIAGKAFNASTGAAIAGATVSLRDRPQAATTDLNGEFRFVDVSVGSHLVIVSKAGFQPLRVTAVEVAAGESVSLELALTPSVDPIVRMEAFSVSADVMRNSGAGLLGARQKAAAVSDAIGAEQMSKLGFGTAAAAMRAITGASVVGGKYVYIRGLGERYSSTMVNGVEVPSADPDRRAVNLDMFPSDLIDAIVTTKTFTPDRPGNFTGGSVDLKTKEFPEQFTYSLSASLAYNSQVTGEPFLSSGAGGNTWGRDDGARALPAALANEAIPVRFSSATVDSRIGELTRAFSSVLAPRTKEAPLNRSFGAALGGVTTLFGRRLGYAASLSYERTFTGYRDGVFGRYERQGVSSPGLAPLVQLSDTRSEDDTLIGGLFNVAYQISPQHQVSFNTMLSQSGNDMARRQGGLNIAGGGISETEIFTTRTLRYTERALRSFQLAGKHLLPWRELRLDWNATDATTSQDEPDTRYFSSFQTPDGNEFFEASGLPRPARYFRNLEEERRDYTLDVTLPFQMPAERAAQLKFGAAYARTERVFRERLFEYNSTALRYDGDEANFLRASQVGQVNPATGRFGAGQLYLVETTSRGNSYSGAQTIGAYYAMVDVPLTSAARIVAGARREATKLDVRSQDPRRRAGMLDNRDLLPSVNVIYALSDKMNVRLAATKTLARPNFREIADYASFEFVGDFVYIGNPDLRRTTIRNYDARWEWFPRRGELIAASVFYKRLRDPIERGVFSIINNGELQYQNAPRGEVRGFEFEARKRFDTLPGEALRHLSGGINYTWVDSAVDIATAELAFIRFYEPDAKSSRELTGQSAHVLNLDLTYSHPGWGTTLSVYGNFFGPRLSQVSPPGTPNVYERPAPTLDLVWHQRLRERWKLTLSVKNALNSAFEETYTYRGVESLRASYSRGVTTSFGLAFTY